MSFLYRAGPAIRTAARPSTRLFSTSIAQRKSAAETVKDGLKAVDQTISGAAVKGIDKAEALKDKAAAATSSNASQAEGQASELAGEAKGKAAELTGQAKGKAAELKGEAKSKLS